MGRKQPVKKTSGRDLFKGEILVIWSFNENSKKIKREN